MMNYAMLWGAVCGKAARTVLRGVYAVMYYIYSLEVRRWSGEPKRFATILASTVDRHERQNKIRSRGRHRSYGSDII